MSMDKEWETTEEAPTGTVCVCVCVWVKRVNDMYVGHTWDLYIHVHVCMYYLPFTLKDNLVGVLQQDVSSLYTYTCYCILTYIVCPYSDTFLYMNTLNRSQLHVDIQCTCTAFFQMHARTHARMHTHTHTHAYLPSVATDESALANHLPRGRNVSLINDLYRKGKKGYM